MAAPTKEGAVRWILSWSDSKSFEYFKGRKYFNEAPTVGVKQLVTHIKSYIVESLLLLPSKRRFLTVTATSVE